ncbi:putative maf protein [Chytriomyces sp. MP71]|nr:putative maf protein [Chytriomyces sp. MP71]
MKLSLPSPAFTFVLGSSSKSRASILDKHGVSFKVVVADIDEKAIGDRNLDKPSELVLRIANAKMDALISSGKLAEFDPCIVVACDQVAVYKGRIREKPTTETEAREYLTSYRAAPVETYGGVAVFNTVTKKRVQTVDIAKQHFTNISDEAIDALIVAGRIYSCAGGFTIEDPILQPFLGETEGEDGGWDSIMGLSLTVVQRLIDQTL